MSKQPILYDAFEDLGLLYLKIVPRILDGTVSGIRIDLHQIKLILVSDLRILLGCNDKARLLTRLIKCIRIE